MTLSQHLISARTMLELADKLHQSADKHAYDFNEDRAIISQTMREIADLIRQTIEEERKHYERLER